MSVNCAAIILPFFLLNANFFVPITCAWASFFGVGKKLITTTTTAKPDVDILIPRKFIFDLPTFSHVQLNSDGSLLSYMMNNHTEGSQVMFKDFKTNVTDVATNTSYGEVYGYSWSCLPTHFFARQKSDETTSYVIYSFDSKTRQFDSHVFASTNGTFSMQIVERTCLNKTESIFLIQDFANESVQFVEEFNLLTRKLTILLRSDKKLRDVVFDNSPELRIISTSDDNGTTYYRPNFPGEKSFHQNDIHWSIYKRMRPVDDHFSKPLGFAKDNAHMYWLDSSASEFAKPLVHPFGHFSSRKVLYNPLRGEIGAMFADPVDLTILSLVENDATPTVRLVHHKIGVDFQYINNEFNKDDVAVIVSTSKNLSRWVIAVNSNHRPLQYHLYHRDENRFDFLFDVRENLTAKLFPAVNVTVLRLNHAACYIYRPSRCTADCNKTLLIVGDTRTKFSTVFDPMTSWLNNRGYIVTKCNLHGSMGYGKRWFTPGLKLEVVREFLRTMHLLRYHNFAWPNSTALIVMGDSRPIAEDASLKCGQYVRAVISLENLYESESDLHEVLPITHKIPMVKSTYTSPPDVLVTNRSVPLLVIEGYEDQGEVTPSPYMWRNPNTAYVRVHTIPAFESRRRRLELSAAFAGYVETFLAKILHGQAQSFWPLEYPHVQIIGDAIELGRQNPFIVDRKNIGAF